MNLNLNTFLYLGSHFTFKSYPERLTGIDSELFVLKFWRTDGQIVPCSVQNNPDILFIVDRGNDRSRKNAVNEFRFYFYRKSPMLGSRPRYAELELSFTNVLPVSLRRTIHYMTIMWVKSWHTIFIFIRSIVMFQKYISVRSATSEYTMNCRFPAWLIHRKVIGRHWWTTPNWIELNSAVVKPSTSATSSLLCHLDNVN